MSNIIFKIDVKKLRKDRFEANSFTTRDGQEVQELNAKLVAVEKKEPRLIKSGDTWDLKETHFVAEEQTKEERERKEKSNIVGSGVQFVDKNSVGGYSGASDGIDESYPSDDINPDDIPF